MKQLLPHFRRNIVIHVRLAIAKSYKAISGGFMISDTGDDGRPINWLIIRHRSSLTGDDVNPVYCL